MASKPRRPAARFLTASASNPRAYSYRPLRELPLVADEEDLVEQVRAATNMRDEPECIGPAILASYAEVNRRIMSQQIVLEVAEAQERRADLTPQHRLDDIRRRAKEAHVDMSHPVHLVQKQIDRARLRDQPVGRAALDRLEGLEALLDGVSIKRLAA